MADKLILLQHGDAEISVTIGATIHRDELYGKQTKTVEKDGEPLQKVILDPEGNVFLPSDVTHLPTDGQGSLAEPALVQSEDGETLDPKPSSFKEKRPLHEAGVGDLAALRVDSIIPVQCDLPPGLYRTEFTYRDAPVLKTAVLTVTAEGSFLLVGTPVETPLQGKTDVYSFFDAGDDEPDDDEAEDEISFVMF